MIYSYLVNFVGCFVAHEDYCIRVRMEIFWTTVILTRAKWTDLFAAHRSAPTNSTKDNDDCDENIHIQNPKQILRYYSQFI